MELEAGPLAVTVSELNILKLHMQSTSTTIMSRSSRQRHHRRCRSLLEHMNDDDAANMHIME